MKKENDIEKYLTERNIKLAEKNYNQLYSLAKDILTGKGSYVSFDNENKCKFVIKKLNDKISISNEYAIDDVMPEIVFKVDHENKRIIPIHYCENEELEYDIINFPERITDLQLFVQEWLEYENREIKDKNNTKNKEINKSNAEYYLSEKCLKCAEKQYLELKSMSESFLQHRTYAEFNKDNEYLTIMTLHDEIEIGHYYENDETICNNRIWSYINNETNKLIPISYSQYNFSNVCFGNTEKSENLQEFLNDWINKINSHEFKLCKFKSPDYDINYSQNKEMNNDIER